MEYLAIQRCLCRCISALKALMSSNHKWGQTANVNLLGFNARSQLGPAYLCSVGAEDGLGLVHGQASEALPVDVDDLVAESEPAVATKY